MSEPSKSPESCPLITCLDLEGVLLPEIWVALAHSTGIDDLKLTTRDIADYNELMRHRLRILDQHQLTLTTIHQVINTLDPLEGAPAFLAWLRKQSQVIILSDTFGEFIAPLMAKLHYPTIFCHSLIIDENKRVVDYRLRQQDQKRKAVQAFHSLNFRTVAVGDSYNDVSMLREAHAGIFFRPTQAITQEYPQFPVTHTYEDLKTQLCRVARLEI